MRDEEEWKGKVWDEEENEEYERKKKKTLALSTENIKHPKTWMYKNITLLILKQTSVKIGKKGLGVKYIEYNNPIERGAINQSVRISALNGTEWGPSVRDFICNIGLNNESIPQEIATGTLYILLQYN